MRYGRTVSSFQILWISGAIDINGILSALPEHQARRHPGPRAPTPASTRDRTSAAVRASGIPGAATSERGPVSLPGNRRSTLDRIPKATFCLSTFPPIFVFQLLLVSLKPSCLLASFCSAAFCREQFQEALSWSSDPDKGRSNRNSCLSGRQSWFCLHWTVDRFPGFE